MFKCFATAGVSCFGEMSLSNCDRDDKRQSPSVCVRVRILTVSACYAPTCTLKVRVSLAVTTISSTQPVLDYNGILDFRILGKTGLTAFSGKEGWYHGSCKPGAMTLIVSGCLFYSYTTLYRLYTSDMRSSCVTKQGLLDVAGLPGRALAALQSEIRGSRPRL